MIKDCFLGFDLKPDYHHIDIWRKQLKYNAFYWKGQHYCFNVLVFGLTLAPYIFTKYLKRLVNHWRAQGIDIVSYLDNYTCKKSIFSLAFAVHRVAWFAVGLKRFNILFSFQTEKNQSTHPNNYVFVFYFINDLCSVELVNKNIREILPCAHVWD